MMRLKYLFENGTLAKTMLDRWEHEGEPAFWRASANMVYRCEKDGKACYLRISPNEEREPDQIEAELAYVQYLGGEGYPAVQPIPSKAGNMVEAVETGEGVCYGVLFAGAPGISLGQTAVDADAVYQWGRHLGWLHRLAMAYRSTGTPRNDWRARAAWMGEVLGRFPNEDAARGELDRITEYLSHLPATEETYGLVHYDFETDNVFTSEDGLHIIDFDDAVYHFYMMDIAVCLDEIDDVPEDRREALRQAFLSGYRSEKDFPESGESLLPWFSRYNGLLTYVKLLRAMEGSDIPDAPDWYEELLVKLTNWCDRYRERIGA